MVPVLRVLACVLLVGLQQSAAQEAAPVYAPAPFPAGVPVPVPAGADVRMRVLAEPLTAEAREARIVQLRQTLAASAPAGPDTERLRVELRAQQQTLHAEVLAERIDQLRRLQTELARLQSLVESPENVVLRVRMFEIHHDRLPESVRERLAQAPAPAERPALTLVALSDLAAAAPAPTAPRRQTPCVRDLAAPGPELEQLLVELVQKRAASELFDHSLLLSTDGQSASVAVGGEQRLPHPHENVPPQFIGTRITAAALARGGAQVRLEYSLEHSTATTVPVSLFQKAKVPGRKVRRMVSQPAEVELDRPWIAMHSLELEQASGRTSQIETLALATLETVADAPADRTGD